MFSSESKISLIRIENKVKTEWMIETKAINLTLARYLSDIFEASFYCIHNFFLVDKVHCICACICVFFYFVVAPNEINVLLTMSLPPSLSFHGRNETLYCVCKMIFPSLYISFEHTTYYVAQFNCNTIYNIKRARSIWNCCKVFFLLSCIFPFSFHKRMALTILQD